MTKKYKNSHLDPKVKLKLCKFPKNIRFYEENKYNILDLCGLLLM